MRIEVEITVECDELSLAVLDDAREVVSAPLYAEIATSQMGEPNKWGIFMNWDVGE